MAPLLKGWFPWFQMQWNHWDPSQSLHAVFPCTTTRGSNYQTNPNHKVLPAYLTSHPERKTCPFPKNGSLSQPPSEQLGGGPPSPRAVNSSGLFATFEKIGDPLKKESFTTRGSMIFPQELAKRLPPGLGGGRLDLGAAFAWSCRAGQLGSGAGRLRCAALQADGGRGCGGAAGGVAGCGGGGGLGGWGWMRNVEGRRRRMPQTCVEV